MRSTAFETDTDSPRSARTELSSVTMDRDHLLDLRKKEAHYWWHVNKRAIVLQLLEKCASSGRNVLEVGSGGGYLSTFLTSRGWSVVAADLSPEASSFIHAQAKEESESPRPLAFDAGASWPFDGSQFDVVLMLDLLEHVPDDAKCLKEARRVLKPRGVVIFTVPVHPSLYSAWDRMAGHQRRYTMRTLREVVAAATLRRERVTYWNAISLLPAIVIRGKERWLPPKKVRAEFPEVPEWLNALLKAAGSLEIRWMTLLPLPVGLSVAGILRKDEA